MTQATLDMVVHAYCDGCQEFIGDYELEVTFTGLDTVFVVSVIHKNVHNIELPWSPVNTRLKPKEQAKIIIGLVKQIIENGDEWLQDEKDYEADKAAEKWDNDRKSDLEN